MLLLSVLQILSLPLRCMRAFAFASLLLLTLASGPAVAGQINSPFPRPTELQQGPPLTNQEYVALLYQLPKHPEERDRLIDQIRKRGIGFQLTPGLLSLTATKSGNDTLLRHTLEEANRRRINPALAVRPSLAEAAELLERSRKATLGAAERMPDFLVKQQITRSQAYGQTRNWSVYDRLSIAVSYRQGQGEDYKLLAVNGVPAVDQSYGINLGGTVSAGEYVTVLSDLFKPETRAEFEMVDTALTRGRRTVVYEYLVKKEFSRQGLGWGERGVMLKQTIVGLRGRIWVDIENNRVLRLESIATEIEPGFPITADSKVIDYDWVSINDQRHLLPSRALVELTARAGSVNEQTRNDILFRGYRKFGTEVKITDIDETDFPADPPEDEPKRPETAPVLKPPPIKKP